jgi:hypothetical protein
LSRKNFGRSSGKRKKQRPRNERRAFTIFKRTS